MTKEWIPRTDQISLSFAASLTIAEVPEDIVLLLRGAASKQSLSSGQGFIKCNCKASGTKCKTNRCYCFKSKVHKSTTFCKK